MLLQHEDSMCEGVIREGIIREGVILWAFYFENYINLSNIKCKMQMRKSEIRKKQSHSLPSLRGGAKPPQGGLGVGLFYFTIPFSKYSARLQRTF